MCKAVLFIGDSFGDNEATMKCQLEEGHEGSHQESFKRSSGNEVVITWTEDETPAPPKCAICKDTGGIWSDEEERYADCVCYKHGGVNYIPESEGI